MKLCVHDDWLRRQIEDDTNTNVEAGRAISRSVDVVKAAEAVQQTPPAEAPTASTPNKNDALGLLVQLTRRRDKLTVAQFAERIRVSAEEVATIETDPVYSPAREQSITSLNM